MCPHEINSSSKPLAVEGDGGEVGTSAQSPVFYFDCLKRVIQRLNGELVESGSHNDREQLEAARQASDGDNTVYQCQICPARYIVAESAGKLVIVDSNDRTKEVPSKE